MITLNGSYDNHGWLPREPLRVVTRTLESSRENLGGFLREYSTLELDDVGSG